MNRHVKELEGKIASRQARVGIVGLGYVGLPLAAEFGRAGFRVTGVDVDAAKIAMIRAGRSHVEDVPSATVKELVRKGLLTAHSEYSHMEKMDAIVICVPTPLSKTRDPDISYIVSALDRIAPRIRAGQLVVLESTTYPGTTEEVLRPRLEAGGLKAGRDFFLAFSPERVDPGNQFYNTRNTPKIVGGTTPACTRMAALFYKHAVDTVHSVSSTQSAEMIKLLENTFRAVNIGLVNEISLMCEKLQLDVWEIIDGAATKPFGFMRFYPGPGIGGHCIPLDPHYLSWKLKTLNYSARFIELASEVNGHMPEVVVRRAASLLNTKKKSLNGAKVFLLGVAYKKDTTDTRESPALDVIQLLREQGAVVSFHDPFARAVHLERDGPMRGTALTPAALRKADLVVILTDHSAFDYPEIVRHAKIILDTRNGTKTVKAGRAKIHRL